MNLNELKVEKIEKRYAQSYKQNYPDCKTLRDSFNRETNEILVFVPKRMLQKGIMPYEKTNA